MKTLKLAIIFALFALNAEAQANKYWIFFKDKPHAALYTNPAQVNSVACLQNRFLLHLNPLAESDIPVFLPYQKKLEALGVVRQNTSKWLNAQSAFLSNEQLEMVKNLPFVAQITPIRVLMVASLGKDVEINYDIALKYMNADAMRKANLTGAGVKVGVLDVGFQGANLALATEKMVAKQLVNTRDFVAENEAKTRFENKDFAKDDPMKIPETEAVVVEYKNVEEAAVTVEEIRDANEKTEAIPMEEALDSTNYELISVTLDEIIDNNAPKKDYEIVRSPFFLDENDMGNDHGSTVLKFIGGVVADNQRVNYKGFATDAQFYLGRTDHPNKENRMDEDNWVAGLEWLEQQGVRLVNSSLGYTKFDDEAQNYTPAQMDGNTAVSTKAANIAAVEKGMILVAAAGNEGDSDDWKIISAPADSRYVMSVGATDLSNAKQDYSSEGNERLSYQKPNISTFAIGGTSFAAPIITGFAACILQAKPDASATEVFEFIEKAGHLYPYGNDQIGYGVPRADKLLKIMNNDGDVAMPRLVQAAGKKSVKISFSKPIPRTQFVMLYAKNSRINAFKTLNTSKALSKKSKLSVSRFSPETTSTTVNTGFETIEIVW